MKAEIKLEDLDRILAEYSKHCVDDLHHNDIGRFGYANSYFRLFADELRRLYEENTRLKIALEKITRSTDIKIEAL